MRAEEVLLRKAELVQQLRDRDFGEFVRFSLEHEYGSYRAKGGKMPTRRANARDREMSDYMIEALRAHVRLSDVYRVTPDMCDLVAFAASRLDETDTIDRTLPPSVWGFVRFDKPLRLVDVRGIEMLVHYMTWGPAAFKDEIVNRSLGDEPEARMMFVTTWNDAWEEPDQAYLQTIDILGNEEQVRRTMGRWAFTGADVLIDGESLGPAEIMPSPETVEALLAQYRHDAEELGEKFMYMVPDEVVPFTNTQRLIHALWLLLGQTVTVVEPEHIKSSVAKRIGRMKIPPRVSVITLRKRTPKHSEGPSLVEWQHRWVVRGHWAWRVCGPNHPLAQNAPVKGGIGCRLWINPFIKGPEDKPLAITEHVYQLSR